MRRGFVDSLAWMRDSWNIDDGRLTAECVFLATGSSPREPDGFPGIPYIPLDDALIPPRLPGESHNAFEGLIQALLPASESVCLYMAIGVSLEWRCFPAHHQVLLDDDLIPPRLPGHHLIIIVLKEPCRPWPLGTMKLQNHQSDSKLHAMWLHLQMGYLSQFKQFSKGWSSLAGMSVAQQRNRSRQASWTCQLPLSFLSRLLCMPTSETL